MIEILGFLLIFFTATANSVIEKRYPNRPDLIVLYNNSDYKIYCYVKSSSGYFPFTIYPWSHSQPYPIAREYRWQCK